ncbi:MAG: hypothetical protein ACXW1D_00710 [Halobacteriota archaeon]
MRGFQKTQKEFIDEATEKHGAFYSYDKTVYVRSKDKLIVTCPIHGDFSILANNHVSGKGCKHCAIASVSASKTLGREVFIDRARIKHGDRYDYSVSQISTMKSPTNIICQKHGKFTIIPANHLTGEGCTKCSLESRRKSQMKTLKTFLQDCIKVHGTKYDYRLITEYNGAKSKIDIICGLHGVFSQTADHHYNGTDCPQCKPGGYNNKSAGTFYVLMSGDITKVGITNKPTKTRAEYINSKSKLGFEVIAEMYSKDGTKPQQIEKLALRWLRENYSCIDAEFNGSTECFLDVDMERLMNLIETFL